MEKEIEVEIDRERERDLEPQPPVDPSVGSLYHPCITTTHLSYRCPIFETSVTAFCCTTGISGPTVFQENNDVISLDKFMQNPQESTWSLKEQYKSRNP